jgi:hypothetical protein
VYTGTKFSTAVPGSNGANYDPRGSGIFVTDADNENASECVSECRNGFERRVIPDALEVKQVTFLRPLGLRQSYSGKDLNGRIQVFVLPSSEVIFNRSRYLMESCVRSMQQTLMNVNHFAAEGLRPIKEVMGSQMERALSFAAVVEFSSSHRCEDLCRGPCLWSEYLHHTISTAHIKQRV